MALYIRIAARREFCSRDLWEMHRLRARVFKGRLGWEVPILSGMEIDGYDALEPLYMMMREPRGGALIGCWRLLPTEGPYMLKDSFSVLLQGGEAPRGPRLWELSRFALATAGGHGFGFSAISLEAIGAVICHGYHHEIDAYVTVTTTAIERLLRRAGVVIERLRAPQQIGVETAVALYVDVAATYRALVDARRAC